MPDNPKERSPDQTAISVSIRKDLLAMIDARAETLNMTRSQYLAVLAQHDLSRGGRLVIQPPDASKPQAPVDLPKETLEFLFFAIPVFDNYERNHKSAPSPSGEPEPPDSIDDNFWSFFLQQREEILRYKWIESEKAGRDIGIESAIREWLQKHFTLWVAAQARLQNATPPTPPS
jgi:hypothetical protein